MKTKATISKTKMFLTFLLLLLSTPEMFGQDHDKGSNKTFDLSNSRNYIGLNAGFTTGIGFSYIYFPNRNGFQLTALPLYDKNKMLVSFGTAYLREIQQYNNSRLVFYASNHLTNMFSYQKEWVNNTGIGIGLDFQYSGFMYTIKVGYAALDMLRDFKTRPVAEMGFFYSF